MGIVLVVLEAELRTNRSRLHDQWDISGLI
jgi:hypothetical protein